MKIVTTCMLILLAIASSMAFADSVNYADLEKKWNEQMERATIIEIHGAADFDPMLQGLFNVSNRFTGDFTHGVILAQITPTRLAEAEALIGGFKGAIQRHSAGTDELFSTLAAGLFIKLEQGKFMKKEPVKYHAEQGQMAPLHGNPAKSMSATRSEETRSCSSYCDGFPEGFEGYPWYEEGGNWYHFQYGYNNDGGYYFWIDNSCDAHTGSYSADAIRGGAYGSTLSCSDYYPPSLTSYMKYAYWITCAAGASCANLSFYYKVNSESSYDYLSYWFSVDDNYYYGYGISGNYSGSWYNNSSQDLTNWYTLGNLTTYSEIAIEFVFSSDSSDETGFGARVDDISLTYGGGSSAPSCASGPNPSSGATGVSTAPTLSWGAVSNATSYDVYFGTNSSSIPYVATTSGTSYTPGTLNHSTTYWWGVIPKNSSGSATGCPAWNFTTVGTGGCSANATTLCLNSNRFRVTVQWWDYSGNTGPGQVVPYGSTDSGMFWFFASTNWEMLIKVLNGCGTNNHYWVYAAATTDVQYKLYVTDTSTGATKEYDNPPHNASPAITDSSAFATCP